MTDRPPVLALARRCAGDAGDGIAWSGESFSAMCVMWPQFGKCDGDHIVVSGFVPVCWAGLCWRGHGGRLSGRGRGGGCWGGGAGGGGGGGGRGGGGWGCPRRPGRRGHRVTSGGRF